VAESPSHRFGQIVGNLLEEILQPVLKQFCEERSLYLDVKGARSGIRKGKKVTWADRYGNNHDLDFVIEKGAQANKRGQPVAFIEAAWRRYTKHSRNKAQEIQGAILPIFDAYPWDRPFLGAVLAGEFTKGSLNQLKSIGFQVLYFPYESVISAFSSVGIDARFDEDTPDSEFKKCVSKIESLSTDQHEQLKEYLVSSEKQLFNTFLKELAAVLDRTVERLLVIPLYGSEESFSSITAALAYIQDYQATGGAGPFRKFEIVVKFSNGDTIDASFKSQAEVRKFLAYLGT